MNASDTTKKSDATVGAEKRGKTLRGVVVSTKMQDSAVVRVEQYKKHPKYKKFIRQSKKYVAHDPGNTVVEGDTVTIVECAPISKRKRFRVVNQ